jgi:hypothetical protein
MKNIFTLAFAVCVYVIHGNLYADQVDIGLFESTSPTNQLEVRVRPDYNINGWPITNIVYTVRWNDPSVTINTNWIPPYLVSPSGSPVNVNGWMYQIFVAVPFTAYVTWTAGTEHVISTFTYSAGCATFEIIEDAWTYSHNGDYYFSVGGFDRTGIIYQPTVNLGSVGGEVTGGGIITLGESTGDLTLVDYIGSIVKWQKSFNGGVWSDIPGTAGLTVYSEIPTAIGIWEYRAQIQRGTCAPVYSLPAQVIVLPVETEWTGAISDDWQNDGNWTYGKPNQYVDAIIPDVAPQPFPLLDGYGDCDALDIDAGASVTVGTDGFLTAWGATQNEGDLLIKSIFGATGSFIDNGTIAGNGTNRVERFIKRNRWHYVSPPVSDAVSMVFLHIYLKWFNEEDSVWTYIVPTDIPLIAMQGYATWAAGWLTDDTTVTYIGTLNTGPMPVDLTNHGLAQHNSKGFNFIGNPYTSAIDWELDDGNGWTRTNLDNTIYTWNPYLYNYGTYTKGIPGSGTNQVDNIIPAGQGFFVHVTTGNPTGFLEVNNLARLHSDEDILKSSAAANETRKFLKLRSTSEACPGSDELVVLFEPAATEDYDGQFDAFKLEGTSEAPQMHTRTPGGIKLAVNTLPELTANLILPLYYKAGVPGNYSLEVVSLINFEASTQVLLEDLKTGQVTDLKGMTVYTFEASPLDDIARFRLHFLTEPFGITETEINGNLTVYSYANDLYVESKDHSSLTASLMVYDLQGRLILSRELSGGSLYKIPMTVNPGMYLVEVIFDRGKTSTKVMIR